MILKRRRRRRFASSRAGVRECVWRSDLARGPARRRSKLRIDTDELGCGDQRVNRSGAPAAVVGAGEGPVLSPESNGPQLAFRRIVRHAKTPIIEEVGEGACACPGA